MLGSIEPALGLQPVPYAFPLVAASTPLGSEGSPTAAFAREMVRMMIVWVVRTFARTPITSPTPKKCRFWLSPGRGMPLRADGRLERISQDR